MKHVNTNIQSFFIIYISNREHAIDTSIKKLDLGYCVVACCPSLRAEEGVRSGSCSRSYDPSAEFVQIGLAFNWANSADGSHWDGLPAKRAAGAQAAVAELAAVPITVTSQTLSVGAFGSTTGEAVEWEIVNVEGTEFICFRSI
jgi:hypothetical protein